MSEYNDLGILAGWVVMILPRGIVLFIRDEVQSYLEGCSPQATDFIDVLGRFLVLLGED